jgi:Xaa-Pro aminopeptidase
MIKEKEYTSRRKKLLKKLAPNSLALICSAKQKTRSNDTEFPYRQNSDFYYLTGFKEDNAALVLIKTKKTTKCILFVQKKEPKMELWTGKRLGEKEAKKYFDVDAVYSSDKLEEQLDELLKKKELVYFDFDSDDARVKKLRKHAKKVATRKNSTLPIRELRLTKSTAEIKIIKHALSITKEAHHNAMKKARTLKYEYELQAEFEYIFKRSGAYSDAYTSIVACGDAANTLHYIENNKPLVKDELVLIDAGCEYEYYASDITRTFPVGGKFSKEQKELYELVLDVQLQIIKMIKPKVLRSKLQKKASRLLSDGLVDLGVLKGDKKKLYKEGAYKKYYPHGIGHWMGLDVHDQAPYKDENDKEIPFQAGMVLTIEPGLYMPKSDTSIPKKYRGIGIRIEDNILITKDGCENLSADIIKSVKDIEALSAKA